jgi:hypothetical protein
MIFNLTKLKMRKITLFAFLLLFSSNTVAYTTQPELETTQIYAPEDFDGFNCVDGFCIADNIECDETKCTYDSRLEDL